MAWEQLFGRSAQQVEATDLATLKYLEHRLLFLRITLIFGWERVVDKEDNFGKLCVLGVKM